MHRLGLPFCNNVHYLSRSFNSPEGVDDVLGELKAALEGALPIDDSASDQVRTLKKERQRIDGDGNLQLSDKTVLSQSIKGNNNIQICTLNLIVQLKVDGSVT